MKPYKSDIWFIFLGGIVFLIPLILIWYGYRLLLLPQAVGSALLGVLPYSDAHGYYDGAFQYLDSGSLSYWNLRRPIHTLLFSSELFLTNKNYWYAIILQTFMCGLSCSVASYTIAKAIDKVSGILFFIISFVLALSFTPTTLSETTGIALGMLAFVFIWVGYISRQILTFSFSIFVLTLALHARAGPFFILPCLILLAIFDFTKSIKMRLQIFILSCIAIIAATYLNLLLQKFFGDGSNQIHANFSYTIFGLVSGGKGWCYSYTVYPSLSSMPEAEQAALLYKESLKTFLKDPSLTFLGLLKSLGGFIKFHLNFFLTNSYVRKFVWLKILIKVSSFSLFCFCVYFFKKAYVNKDLSRIVKFIVAGFTGIILSAMVIYQDGGIRVFSATYAFWALALSSIYAAYKYKDNIKSFKINISDRALDKPKLITILVLCYYFIAIVVLPVFSVQPQRTKDFFSTNLEKDTVLIQNVSKYAYMVVHYNKNTFSNNGLRETTRDIYISTMLKLAPILDSKSFLNAITQKDVTQSFIIFAAKSLYFLSDTNILKTIAPFLELKGRFKDNFFIVNSYKPIY